MSARGAMNQFRLYRGDWIANEGQPWLLSVGWLPEERQLAVERWLFSANSTDPTNALFRPLIIDGRAFDVKELGVAVDLEYLFGLALEIAEADLRVYLSEKYPSQGYLYPCELRPVELSRVVSLAVVAANKPLLRRVQQGTQVPELRKLTEALQSISTVSIETL
jgi:hypothetical protein